MSNFLSNGLSVVAIAFNGNKKITYWKRETLMTVAMCFQIINLAISINIIGNQSSLTPLIGEGNYFMLTAKFQTRLNEYVILGVFASGGLFLTLSNLLPNSFAQSEFDLRHTKMFDDIYRVDFLQLHYREMNLFCNACGPFFVNLLCYTLSNNEHDPCLEILEWLVGLSLLSTVFFSIFFFGKMHEQGCLSKVVFLLSLLMYLLVVPIATLVVLYTKASPILKFKSAYSLWFYIVFLMQFHPAL